MQEGKRNSFNLTEIRNLYFLYLHVSLVTAEIISVLSTLYLIIFRGVIVLDQEGDVKNIYTGHPDVNHKNKLFCPTGIVTTPSDKFVVADRYVHIIHILSSDGGILTYHNTETVGVELPSSLSISHTGQLYIGCIKYKDSKEKPRYM
jgi:hypothetical protein